jgi:argininosuccinate lyase
MPGNYLKRHSLLHIFGIMVRKALERGLTPADVTPELIDEASLEFIGRKLELSKEAVTRALNPWQSVESRRVIGGPSPETVTKELQIHHMKLKQNQLILLKLSESLIESEHVLNDKIEEIIKFI